MMYEGTYWYISCLTNITDDFGNIVHSDMDMWDYNFDIRECEHYEYYAIWEY